MSSMFWASRVQSVVEAFAYSGGSVLNAIANWKGSAFAINFKVRAVASPSERLDLTNKLAEEVYKGVREFCELGPVKMRTHSEVPSGGGLKTSSAAANAMALALFKLCGANPSPYLILKVSVEASKRAKVTVTGAFDDASASLLGGLVITDNKNMEIIARRELEGLMAVVLPKSKRSMGFAEIARRLRTLSREFDAVYEELLKGNVFRAMTLNGFLVAGALGYSSDPILEALSEGALAASVSGNGPSYVALVDRDRAEDVLEAWRPYGEPKLTEVVNSPAYLPS